MENIINLEEYFKRLQFITYSDDPNKKTYTDGEKVFYTMMNMGNYVGYRSREFGEDESAEWFLMNYKINHLNGQCEYGEALVDDTGRYLRVDISVDNVRRIIHLNGDYVITDLICINEDETNVFSMGKLYYALDTDIYSNKRVPTSKYFSMEHVFKDDKEEAYQGFVPNDSLFINFSNANNALKSIVEGRKLK